MKEIYIVTNGDGAAAFTSLTEAAGAFALAPLNATIVTAPLYESAQEYHNARVKKLISELPSFQKK